MKWWAFNEEQLAVALKQYIDRRSAELGQLVPASVVINFLDSPEAQQHKMRGDK